MNTPVGQRLWKWRLVAGLLTISSLGHLALSLGHSADGYVGV